jgi:hypothetical protein
MRIGGLSSGGGPILLDIPLNHKHAPFPLHLCGGLPVRIHGVSSSPTRFACLGRRQIQNYRSTLREFSPQADPITRT